jgi:hypothetical protein
MCDMYIYLIFLQHALIMSAQHGRLELAQLLLSKADIHSAGKVPKVDSICSIRVNLLLFHSQSPKLIALIAQARQFSIALLLSLSLNLSLSHPQAPFSLLTHSPTSTYKLYIPHACRLCLL